MRTRGKSLAQFPRLLHDLKFLIGVLSLACLLGGCGTSGPVLDKQIFSSTGKIGIWRRAHTPELHLRTISPQIRKPYQYYQSPWMAGIDLISERMTHAILGDTVQLGSPSYTFISATRATEIRLTTEREVIAMLRPEFKAELSFLGEDSDPQTPAEDEVVLRRARDAGLSYVLFIKPRLIMRRTTNLETHAPVTYHAFLYCDMILKDTSNSKMYWNAAYHTNYGPKAIGRDAVDYFPKLVPPLVTYIQQQVRLSKTN